MKNISGIKIPESELKAIFGLLSISDEKSFNVEPLVKQDKILWELTHSKEIEEAQNPTSLRCLFLSPEKQDNAQFLCAILWKWADLCLTGEQLTEVYYLAKKNKFFDLVRRIAVRIYNLHCVIEEDCPIVCNS